ncbi:MAG: HEAT repeat domain-containing protein [Candidatus Sulfotelmatobacter sp.]
MASRWLPVLLLGCSMLAFGQVAGHFYLEKSTFAPGEPVFLYFEAANAGTKPEYFEQADPYSFCSGYQIHLSGDTPPTSTCARGFAGSCLSGVTKLESGKTRTERILLNFERDLKPGDYDVEAGRNLSYAATDVDYFAAPKELLEEHSQLHFRIDENATPNPAEFQHWLEQLRSTDPEKRREAARTLAALGPKPLEKTLLGFADSTEFRQFAPLALYRLNTPRSMAALADLLGKTDRGTYESIQSADYLAESGDPQWFPLLMDYARRNASISNYVSDAAESGGDQAVPALLELARSPDVEFTRVNAVTALGDTGSRGAVPVLLEFLKKPDTDIAERALSGLQRLTHRTGGDERGGPYLQEQYRRWLQWWAREGSTAPIYKAKECGELTPLN